MEGEDSDTESPRSFQKAAWWKRLVILVAGAAMNFLMGIILMFIVYMPAQQVVEPVIASFESFSTVDGAEGLAVGDRILKLDGERIYVQSDFSLILGLNPGEYHDLVVLRDGKKVEIPNLRMERHEVVSEDGTTQMLFGMNFTLKNLDFPGKIQYAWLQCLDTIRLVRLSIQMLFTGQAGLSDMSGPVGIVQQMSTVAEASPTLLDALLNMLYFGAFIAINLAVMNLLPIPALDGGRVVGVLVTTGVEAITRKKINPKYEGYLHGAGMVLLLGLMAVVMFKDIFYLFR
jgi:regulator of sigma E protease